MPDRPLKRPRLPRPLSRAEDAKSSKSAPGKPETGASTGPSADVTGLRPTLSEFGQESAKMTPPQPETSSRQPDTAGAPTRRTQLPARRVEPTADQKSAGRRASGQRSPGGETADEELFERPIVPAAAVLQADARPGASARGHNNKAGKNASPRIRGLRKPSPTPLYLAAIGSAFWTGIMAAYAIGYYGPGGLLTLPPVNVALLAAALFAPLGIIWGFASIMWWGAQMRASAEHMAEASRALLTPVDASSAATASVGHAVSSEMRRMERALHQAETRAADLRKSINGELNSLEAASARAEMRARTLRDLVGAERKALSETAHALEAESAHVVEATRAQVELVSGVTGRAADQMTQAQAGIGRASEYLSKTLEAVARSTKAVRENVEAQADRLDATAEHAVANADELAARFTDQGDALTRTAKTLADENERAVRAFAEQRETLDALATDLRERATTIEEAMTGHAGLINEALDAADAKAMGLGPRVTREAERLTAAARDAASQIEQTTGLMGERTTDMQTRVADATGHLSQTLDFSIKNVDASGERLQALLNNIGNAAQSAANDMQSATSELGAHLERLPEDTSTQAERLRAVMGEQIGAIAAVAESVANALERMGPGPVSGSWPPAEPKPLPSAAAFSPAGSDTSDIGSNSVIANTTGDTRTSGNQSPQWKLGDVLSAARAREDRTTTMPRAAHHIIETLQSLSIDIDRALEEEPQLDLWKRYRAGERNVFARRLASLKGKEPHTRITERYQSNAEFRGDADRYMTQFETLLADASEKNPDGLVAETYLSSDVGKVYALLAEATGRIA